MRTTNKKKTTASVTNKSASQPPATITDQLPDFVTHTGAGFEGADKDSFAIPFLRVLQKISPQCDEGNAAYIEGAKGGDLVNSVTGKLYDGKVGVTFLPCTFQRRFIRWAPRGDQRGYTGALLPEQVDAELAAGRVKDVDGKLLCVDDHGKFSEKSSDRLADTRSHFGLLVDGDEVCQVLLALGSTQIRKSKQLLSMLNAVKLKASDGNLVTPPTWVNRVKVTTVLESNDQGSWYGVRFELDGFIDSRALYSQGAAFYEAIVAGQVGASYEAAPAEDAKGF